MMKTLGSGGCTYNNLKLFSCKKHIETNLLCSKKEIPATVGINSKLEIGFVGYQKRGLDGYNISSSHGSKFLLHSISKQASFSSHAFALQKDVECEDIQTINSDSSKSVHVTFKLEKECAFGEQFLIVGDDPIFGVWDPSDGVPLNWSDGHIWTAELDIPTGKVIKYKFILKGDAETVLWQPGEDRTLETQDGETTLTVFGDWDTTELQNIVDEETVFSEESLVESGPLIVDENLNRITPDKRQDEIKELANVNGSYINHEEKISPTMVADNITSEKGLSSSDHGPGLASMMGLKKDEVVNLSSLKDEPELVSDDGIPVLVPGLIPMSFEEINKEEGINDAEPDLNPTSFVEVKKSEVINDAEPGLVPTSIGEVNELEVINDAEPGFVPTSFGEVNESEVINEAELPNEVEKNEVETKTTVESDEVEELTMAELKDEHVPAASQHSTESTEKTSTIDEKQQTNKEEQVENDIIENNVEGDMQWGRRTLQRVLSNFGFQ